MNLIRSLLFFCLISLLPSQIFSQEYSEYSYTVKDGLISDLTKSVIQDSKGFIWIATDEGIARFDGVHFVDYRPDIRTRYFKDFYVTNDGRLLALHDLGLLEIKNNVHSISHKEIAAGSAEDKESLINYGKTIYEDHKGDIWISEGSAVLRITGTGKIKYRFPAREHSFSFLRSFQFFQDKNNNLYVISHHGGIFRLDEKTNKFEPVNTSYKPESVNAIKKISPDEFIIGSASGISLIKINQGGRITHDPLPGNLKEVSTLDERNGLLIAGTWNKGIFITNLKTGGFLFSKLNLDNEKKINRIIFDTEGQIWAATERGIMMLARQDFLPINTISGNNFVQSIRKTDRSTVLIVHGSAVFEFSPSDASVRLLYESQNSNIMAAELKNDLLYIADDLSRLQIIEQNSIKKTIFLLREGTIPSTMLIDDSGNIWMLFYNSPEILRISKDFKHTRFLAWGSSGDAPGKILQDDSGDIYISGFSRDAMLKRFNPGTEKFESVSTGENKSRIRIYDFEKFNGSWYFAADSGLYKLKDSELKPILSSEFDRLSITDIEFDSNGSIWAGTNKGLFRIENEKMILGFDESNGLPARTINQGAIIVTETSVIAGTPNGAVKFVSPSLSQTTKRPYVVLRLHDTGELISWETGEVSILKGESIDLSAISTTYPNKNMLYELVINGDDYAERKFFGTDIEFGSKLPTGTYQVYVRAKKYGNYSWSEAFTVSLTVKGWWYTSWWALLFYIVAAFLLIYGASYVVSLRIRKENQKLESLVRLRTEEISHKNELLKEQNKKIEKQYQELQVLIEQLNESNVTKDKLFSVISHDLKNPFVALLGISELLLEDFDELDDNEKKEFIRRINTSGRITFSLVENLLNWARSQTNRIVLNKTYFNLSELYHNEIAVLSNLSEEKRLQINLSIDENIIVFADRHMISSVARNIIQNAIKYSPSGSTINITAFTTGNFAKISVKDSGVGMTREQISTLFSLEKKKVTLGTFNEKGTGLGLLVCKEFTEANGGEIIVESNPGEGSVFTITLPLKNPEL